MGPERREILVFEVDGRCFGLPAADVREIVRAVTITRLPQAPELVEGVVNLRGQIVPVIYLRWKLGLLAKAIALSDQLINVCSGTFLLALRIDRAVELWTDTPSDPERGQAALDRVAKLAGGLAPILDLRSLVTPEERSAVASLLSQTVTRMTDQKAGP